MSVFDLSTQPLHLGLGATAVVQPTFTGVWHTADADEPTTALFITPNTVRADRLHTGGVSSGMDPR